MHNFWRKVKHQPLKVGIVCLLIVVASGMLVGGNVMAFQVSNSPENVSSNNIEGETILDDTLKNGQYYFSNNFDTNSDTGVYLSVLVNARTGEALNRFLKDGEYKGNGLLGASRISIPSVEYNDSTVPLLPINLFNEFYIPGKLLEGQLPVEENEIMVSKVAAEQYSWQIGDVVKFDANGDVEYSISGIWGEENAAVKHSEKEFLDKYVNLAFIVTVRDIALAQTYTIDELPDDATIVIENKETGEPMYLHPQNDTVDFYNDITGKGIHFTKIDKNTYVIATTETTHNYWTIYIDNPEHAQQFYLDLKNIINNN
ncbi:hypothetical protein [Culicoidibacter larvae]|uniref:Uncharacterized protein n=1 Tax=Culicoidibacter larvae TaxID=2579976 RepID=A0A5R8QFH6_9FIRM|nr:hypothetical protein [Culicoidibacter larvae]TLG76732.1 hypothetical protein FEZ08_03710 [Culicoidibacter larvae]